MKILPLREEKESTIVAIRVTATNAGTAGEI